MHESVSTGYTPKYLSIIDKRRSELLAQLEPILSTARGNDSIVWEVGCGHGHFLTAYASAHPDRTCIGIDLASDRIGRAIKKRDRAKLANLHFLQAEARLFLETLPAGPRIGTVFVLFPDPWPKLRHNKHRIIQSAFLASAAAHAAPGCSLYFRTDYRPYYDAAKETIGADPYWELAADAWAFEYATVFQQRAPTYNSLVARCKTPCATL